MLAGAVEPALLLEAVAVHTRPGDGEPFLLKALGQHHIAVLDDVHFDRQRLRVDHAPDVALPSTQTPEDARPRLDGK